jgi:hypothetical protein
MAGGRPDEFLQSFSEMKLYANFMKFIVLVKKFDFKKQRSSARAVLGRKQVSKIGYTGYVSTENMKFM